MGTVESEVLRYARQYAGETFDVVPPECRLAVRQLVVRQLEFDLGAERRYGRPRLASALFDEFAILNLDWNLIAVTEIGECHLQGFIAAKAVGSRVQRVEPRRDCCPVCKALEGQRFTVVSEHSDEKDWFGEVWRGKSRVRMGASDNAPEGNWPAAGLQHAGCRGRWVSAPGGPLPPGVSKDFADYLDAYLTELLDKV